MTCSCRTVIRSHCRDLRVIAMASRLSHPHRRAVAEPPCSPHLEAIYANYRDRLLHWTGNRTVPFELAISEGFLVRFRDPDYVLGLSGKIERMVSSALPPLSRVERYRGNSASEGTPLSSLGTSSPFSNQRATPSCLSAPAYRHTRADRQNFPANVSAALALLHPPFSPRWGF